jgi:O-antigen ligase
LNGLRAIDFSRPAWLLAAGIAFVLLNALGFALEFYLLPLLPFAILVGYFVVYKPGYALLAIALLTPLSVNLENLAALGGIGVSLPAELMLVALLCLYVLRFVMGHREPDGLMKHPLTVAIIFSLVWMGITALVSSIPVVSYKYMLARLWFVVVMYFFINRFFAKEWFIRWFIWLSAAGLALVVVYTLIHHTKYAYNEKAAHWVMSPFYKDHTSYGAILALLFPFVVYHFWRARPFSMAQVFWLGMLLLYTAGIIFSYTRAAWVSLVAAFGVWVIMRLRIDFRLVLLGGLVAVGTFFAFQDNLTHLLRKNRQDSSADLREHVQSISNVSSDASNLERLNRWNSALRMWQERPFFGFGPGTYMFQYATYQKASDKTIISTNQGDGGNAHSEYLGPLSEQGLIGALAVLILFGVSLYTGITLYYRLKPDSYLRGIVMCIVLGLVTYYLHGILNNYLDTDKASVPIWAMMSMLVAIGMYHRDAHISESGSTAM